MPDYQVAETGYFIKDDEIEASLAVGAKADASKVREILTKARELHGLSLDDVAALTALKDPELLRELFETARYVKERIYGSRIVLFAPLYISNRCCNECLYCAFRASNRELVRRELGHQEIVHEVEKMLDLGHKRVLMVAGESYSGKNIEYVLDSIAAIYEAKSRGSSIRRVNVNIAPLDVEQLKAVKAAKIGTLQVFQETYHRGVYAAVHKAGPKRNYDYRVTVMDRAMKAGIDDVGIGPLFGLADWRFEVLATMQHIRHLEEHFSVGPHTISMPRIEPACGSDLAANPPNAVSDDDFRKIVAIFRCAVPYTGLILSTRETPAMRHELIELGISQISGGSRTNPGGYAEGEGVDEQEAQFHLGDERSLEDVIRDLIQMKHIPSFCTGCYRMGRTGQDFMDLAKPGAIQMHCDPNGLSTFMEYLMDYAHEDTREAGLKLVEEKLAAMPEKRRAVAKRLVDKVREGQRDVYV